MLTFSPGLLENSGRGRGGILTTRPGAGHRTSLARFDSLGNLPYSHKPRVFGAYSRRACRLLTLADSYKSVNYSDQTEGKRGKKGYFETFTTHSIPPSLSRRQHNPCFTPCSLSTHP